MATIRRSQNNQSRRSKRLKLSETIITDIVHGIIELPDYIQAIIDTDQFQRLRYISQMGMVPFVYPSATHTRFQHSIGTFHLASKLIRKIRSQLDKDIRDKRVPEEIYVSDDEIKCVEIAALCHDLGHGPYSHFWEHAFDETIPTRRHEDLSAEIFVKLVNSKKSGHDQSIKQEIDLSDKNIDLVKRIILGKIDKTRDSGKFFLFEIVANKESGLDIDKLDYLCRDSIHLGWSNKNKINDVKRIMHFFRVAKNGNNEWHLAMRDREIFNIHDVFYCRHFLHRYGCQHKTVKIIECLFKEAIKSIVDNKDISKEFIENVLGKDYFKDKKSDEKDNEVWFSTPFVSKVCDHHVWEMMKKHSKDIVKKIQERSLIKLHCEIQILRKKDNQVECIKIIQSQLERLRNLPGMTSGNNENGNICRKIRSLLDKLEIPNKEMENNHNGIISEKVKPLIEELKKLPFIADIATSKFSLQSENKGNPLLSVKFYKKIDKTSCINMKAEDLPGLVKLKSDEFIIMIFTQDNEGDFTSLDKITEILCSEDFNENGLDDIDIDEELKSNLNNEIRNLCGNYKFRKNLY